MGDIIRYTEDTTMDGVSFTVTTAHAMTYRPDVLEDGVAVEILTAGEDAPGQAFWYWLPDGYTVERGDGVPPTAGVVVTVDYEAEVSNAISASAPAVITAWSDYNRSGDIVRVVDVKGLTSAEQARAIASGVLRRASVIPQAIKFSTFENGWEPGQVMSINLPSLELVGDYLVTGVSSSNSRSNGAMIANPKGDGVEYRSSFVRTIDALKIQDAETQDPAAEDPTIPATSYDPLSQFDRVAQQTYIAAPQTQYEVAPFVFGVGGTLTGGVQTSNNHIAAFSGNAHIAIAQSKTPSVGQNIRLDILKNGISIFSTKVTIAAGSSSVVTSTAFVGRPRPFRVKQYDKLTGVLTYVTTSTTVVGGSGISLFLIISR